jgi:hypothetical protein
MNYFQPWLRQEKPIFSSHILENIRFCIGTLITNEMCKRPLPDPGASVKKRPKTSSRTVTDDDSEIIESEESEALPENYAGETKESDGDRRGIEKKEREQKKIEEAAERERQRVATSAANKTKLCIANIGGKRVEKNGIMAFEGGTDFGPFSSRSKAEEATGISKRAIDNNINRGCQSSRGIKGIFKGQKVMFINAPDDTSDKVPCGHCNKHYGSICAMRQHVREKHPGILPPAAKRTRMPEEYKTFTPPITPEQYGRIVNKIRGNIQNDLKKCDQKPELMAMIEGVAELPEPLPSVNIKGAAKKYHFTEEQILDSIANNEELTIGGGRHVLINGRGRTTTIKLAGHKVTFSWKYKVTEEDKIKLLAMANRETYHMIARQNCEYMNAKGMFAKKNVIDDNGGLLKHGFVFESHGGLFAISFDRVEDEYTVNGQIFHKLHYPNLDDALENIRVVALMANVAYKATTAKIQERYDIYKNKSEDQHHEEFKKVLEISHKKHHNGKPTPLYAHAQNFWKHDKLCKGAFDTYQDYWQHMLVLLKEQEGLCKVAKIPMSAFGSGPWKISCDAIDPLLGHVPDNLRLVCLYNNVIDHSKQNKDLTDTRPHNLNTILHDEYWRIVR